MKVGDLVRAKRDTIPETGVVIGSREDFVHPYTTRKNVILKILWEDGIITEAWEISMKHGYEVISETS